MAAAPPPSSGGAFSRLGLGKAEVNEQYHEISMRKTGAIAVSGPSFLSLLIGERGENAVNTTKYTLLTFLPKNLFEQFRRLFNVFWLAQCIIALIPGFTPINPYSTILSFGMVLALSASKDAYEDYQRYKSDKEANSQQVEVLREGDFVVIPSKSLQTGDVVRVTTDCQFPADLVLLSTSDPTGLAYVETSNLDGESALKRFYAMPSTKVHDNAEKLQRSVHFRATVEPPNEHLYKFSGRLERLGPDGQVEAQPEPINADNVTLRGARLKRTACVHGMVVYTGMRTKLQMNSRGAKSKFSHVDRLLNRYIIVIFVVDILVCAGLTAGSLASNAQLKDKWYLPERSLSEDGQNFLTFFILLSALIPLALVVTMELAILAQSLFMLWDDQMCVDDKRMRPYTSALNSELGLIEYVLCDKTGTLTQNKMIFKQCAVQGKLYSNPLDGSLGQDAQGGNQAAAQFLRALTLCNDVVPEKKGDGPELEYASHSPDEVALVDAAAKNGYVLTQREHSSVVYNEGSRLSPVDIIASLEFTPERKRQSVLVKDAQGRYTLMSKGADEAILKCLASSERGSQAETLRFLEQFAGKGNRTLLIAQRSVPEQEAAQFRQLYSQAQNSMEDKDGMLERAYGSLERNMMLLGATSVEDKLQDEVPETVQYLLQAGCHVWVLTGDKLETAESVGRSSSIIDPAMAVVYARAHDWANLQTELSAARSTPAGKAGKCLIIDGFAFTVAKKNDLDTFLALAEECNVVVCARCAPVQKSELVQVVMDRMKKITLAVGDGGNDVPMISTAHVGVGIMGKEGMQAARASDFAIGEFRMLRRLIAVHGRYSLNRTTELIKYSFYKNIAFAAPQIIFCFFNLFSGQSIHNSWINLSYNVFYTGLPPLVIGIFEKDIPEDLIEKYPEAYDAPDRRKPLTSVSLLVNELVGLIQGSVVFLLVAYYYDVFYDPTQTDTEGMTSGIDIQGMIMAPIVVSVVLGDVSLRLKHWTVITFVAIAISWLMVYIVLAILDDLFCPDMNEPVMACGIVIRPVLSHLRSWLFTGVITIGCLVPEVCAYFIRRNYFPTEAMKLLAVHKDKGWAALRQREHPKGAPAGSLKGSPALTPRPSQPGDVPPMPPSEQPRMPVSEQFMPMSEQYGRPPKMSMMTAHAQRLSVSHQFSGPFSMQRTGPPPPFGTHYAAPVHMAVGPPPPLGMPLGPPTPLNMGSPPLMGGDPHMGMWNVPLQQQLPTM